MSQRGTRSRHAAGSSWLRCTSRVTKRCFLISVPSGPPTHNFLYVVLKGKVGASGGGLEGAGHQCSSRSRTHRLIERTPMAVRWEACTHMGEGSDAWAGGRAGEEEVKRRQGRGNSRGKQQNDLRFYHTPSSRENASDAERRGLARCPALVSEAHEQLHHQRALPRFVRPE
jgi:hypothetical protein